MRQHAIKQFAGYISNDIKSGIAIQLQANDVQDKLARHKYNTPNNNLRLDEKSTTQGVWNNPTTPFRQT
jgi:hypothetical protein